MATKAKTSRRRLPEKEEQELLPPCEELPTHHPELNPDGRRGVEGKEMGTVEGWWGTRKDYCSRTVGNTTQWMAPQDSHTVQRNLEQPSRTGEGQDTYRHEDIKAELGERVEATTAWATSRRTRNTATVARWLPPSRRTTGRKEARMNTRRVWEIATRDCCDRREEEDWMSDNCRKTAASAKRKVEPTEGAASRAPLVKPENIDAEAKERTACAEKSWGGSTQGSLKTRLVEKKEPARWTGKKPLEQKTGVEQT